MGLNTTNRTKTEIEGKKKHEGYTKALVIYRTNRTIQLKLVISYEYIRSFTPIYSKFRIGLVKNPPP
jgi:hypothetical protein